MRSRTADDSNPLTGGRLSRRDIGRLMSAGVAALVLPRGAHGEALQGSGRTAERTGPPTAFRLSSNENNYGLAPAAIAALRLKAGDRLREPLRWRGDLGPHRGARQGPWCPAAKHSARAGVGRDSARGDARLHRSGQGPRRRFADLRVAGANGTEHQGRGARQFRWRRTGHTISPAWLPRRRPPGWPSSAIPTTRRAASMHRRRSSSSSRRFARPRRRDTSSWTRRTTTTSPIRRMRRRCPSR